MHTKSQLCVSIIPVPSLEWPYLRPKHPLYPLKQGYGQHHFITLLRKAQLNMPCYHEFHRFPYVDSLHEYTKALQVCVRFHGISFNKSVNQEFYWWKDSDKVNNRNKATGKLLHICRPFTQKGFEILVDKELSNTWLKLHLKPNQDKLNMGFGIMGETILLNWSRIKYYLVTSLWPADRVCDGRTNKWTDGRTCIELLDAPLLNYTQRSVNNCSC